MDFSRYKNWNFSTQYSTCIFYVHFLCIHVQSCVLHVGLRSNKECAKFSIYNVLEQKKCSVNETHLRQVKNSICFESESECTWPKITNKIYFLCYYKCQHYHMEQKLHAAVHVYIGTHLMVTSLLWPLCSGLKTLTQLDFCGLLVIGLGFHWNALHSNPYQMATLREMDSGYLKGVDSSKAVKTMGRCSLGLQLMAA